MKRRNLFKAILAIPFALGLLPKWLQATEILEPMIIEWAKPLQAQLEIDGDSGLDALNIKSKKPFDVDYELAKANGEIPPPDVLFLDKNGDLWEQDAVTGVWTNCTTEVDPIPPPPFVPPDSSYGLDWHDDALWERIGMGPWVKV